MRVLFFNPSTMAFNVSTPEAQPLGGMASCICYLARALAGRGHDVTLVSVLPDGTPERLLGVRHRPLSPVLADAARFFAAEDFDAVLAVNYPDVAPFIKMASPKTINIAWLHIFPDQPALTPLAKVQGMLDYAVYVSQTQRATFDIATPAKVIGNAIAPAFENMFASAAELLAAKQNRAVYASMPFRGLELMVDVMARVAGKTTLDVYSAMWTYRAPEKNFAALYEVAQRNPRIHYHGAIGQVALAAQFRAAAFLTYPSTFIESYCIVAQEALAAGLKVISNDYGALPETTMGYADLLPMQGGTTGREALVAGIAALLEKNESEFLRAPQAWAERMFDQVQAVNRQSTWAARAVEWEAFLAPMVASRRART